MWTHNDVKESAPLHAFLYNFESYGNKNQWKEPTPTLTFEDVHVPISVSIGDILEREPTHICIKDPAYLVRKFMEELKWHGKDIWENVRAEFMSEDGGLKCSASISRNGATKCQFSGLTQGDTI